MNINTLTNCYPVSKTLRFKLIPIGETKDSLNKNRILEKDEERSKEYAKVKKIIDRYHVAFIERSLEDIEIDGVDAYIDICRNKNRSEEDNAKLVNLEEGFRKQIVSSFMKQDDYKKMFGKELILELLPKFLDSEEDIRLVKKFEKFTTAFVGFHENRKNIYTSEPIPTAISYRCINDNLPKYISNVGCYEIIKEVLEDQIQKLDEILVEFGYNLSTSMIFSKDYFNLVLPQKGITLYNAVIGGWVNEDGTKIQGLNEYINLYNQKLDRTEKAKRLPKFQFLYRQILSETESMSFYQEGISTDEELIALLKEIFTGENTIYNVCNMIKDFIIKIDDYSSEGIFISNGIPLTTTSNGAFGSWNAVGSAWENKYRNETPIKKLDPEKYDEKMIKAKKSIPSFSMYEINELMKNYEEKSCSSSVQDYIKNVVLEAIQEVYKEKEVFEVFLKQSTSNFEKNDANVTLIKNNLDSVKNLEHILSLLRGSGTESVRDEFFYGDYYLIYDQLKKIDVVYNLVRNYLTKKPFSTEKYKLYFDQGDFLSGWDAGGNGGKRSAFLLKDGKYYLMISATNTLPIMEECADEVGNYYEKIDYRLLTGANKMLPKVVFSNTHIGKFCPSEDIMRIKRTESFKKGPNFSIEDCHKLIGFYQNCIAKHEWGEKFDFSFKEPNQYEDISRFYREVENQGYKLVRQRIRTEIIDNYLAEGKIYLFQIYNKDFSEHSHGKPNLHTIYFKSLFEEQYQSVIKLNGGAEMFMRRASISKDNVIVHSAGKPIASKNADNPKRSSCFEYDIIKDKRYTADQFEFHIPICLNWSVAGNVRMNEQVRELLHEDRNPYVIGIDRGERNLIYVCVIDGAGKIVEQYSLNSIINEIKDTSYVTDYHKLLDYKERKRKSERQNWNTIENIKELKEGYISQVVHKISQLVIKYNAVVALEDLNSGFKRGRTKVEKQVYQKFEKALIEKFNYLSDKEILMGQNGSVVCGYQLTEKFDSFSRMRNQNGILFYIPAWLTSKIDPTTGFANLLYPKYENKESARRFILSFDKIYFSETEDMFVFEVDYKNFQRTEADFKKKWNLYTNGERIKTFRNASNNGEWDYQIINLTNSLKNLLKEYKIELKDKYDLREAIANIESSKFYIEFLGIIKLMLQMRNSISGRQDIDYLISPVKNSSGTFYDSRLADNTLPCDADANGAFNIARKVLWVIERLRETDRSELNKVKLAMSKKEWLEFAQTHTQNG